MKRLGRLEAQIVERPHKKTGKAQIISTFKRSHHRLNQGQHVGVCCSGVVDAGDGENGAQLLGCFGWWPGVKEDIAMG